MNEQEKAPYVKALQEEIKIIGLDIVDVFDEVNIAARKVKHKKSSAKSMRV